MPPVLGPVSPSPAALVILGGGERQGGLAVHQSEEAELLALQEFLDHQRRPGLAEDPVGHHAVDGRRGLGQRLGDHHALAGGKPVGLDHDGQRWPAT